MEFLIDFSGGSEDSTPGFMISPAPGLKTNNTKAFEAVKVSCSVWCYYQGFVQLQATGLKTRVNGYGSSIPWLILKTWPSVWRTCISRTPHGSLVGGQVISIPCSRQCWWMASTSSTQIDIQTPWSSPSAGPLVVVRSLLPRPPCPS